MQALEPNAANMLAYTYFMENKYKQAYNAYLIAAEQYRDYLKLAVQYRSLSGIQSSIRNDNAEAYMSAGVCLEKMGNLEESLGMYSRALGAEPMHARAYFNRSVIYWQRGDWPAVVRELQEALCIDPNYRDAAYYLQIAKQKLK
jgi:tetratricopeptide (TPR) repeat protein